MSSAKGEESSRTKGEMGEKERKGLPCTSVGAREIMEPASSCLL